MHLNQNLIFCVVCTCMKLHVCAHVWRLEVGIDIPLHLTEKGPLNEPETH